MSDPARDELLHAGGPGEAGERGRRPRKDPDRVAFLPNGFVVTREYELFAEFLGAVRRYRWMAVCTGEAGVGKTRYAERYATWDVIKPVFPRHAYCGDLPREVAECRTVYYKVPVVVTPKQLVNEIKDRRRIVSQLVDRAARDHGVDALEGPMGLEDRTELLIVDEAQRLKGNALEQMRDIYDDGGFGVAMLSKLSSYERILATDERFRVRLSPPYRLKTPRAAPMRQIVARPDLFDVGLPPEAFSDEEAVSAIIRATSCNFGYLMRLVQQIEDTLRANRLEVGPGSVTLEVVEIAVKGREKTQEEIDAESAEDIDEAG